MMLLKTVRYLILSLTCLLQFCKQPDKKNPVQFIKLRIGISHEMDLNKRTFKTYYHGGDSLMITYNMNKSEDSMYERIKGLFSEIGYCSAAIYIDKNWKNVPVIYTTILVGTNRHTCIINVAENCYSNDNRQDKLTRAVDSLLAFKSLITSKPEILKIPKSDIMYY